MPIEAFIPGEHGFLDSGGTFTQIDAPGATITTFANGINDAGQIVGGFSNGYAHGFLDSGGTFTQIDAPGTDTIANGINDAGQIVGYFYNGTGEHGFLDSGGTFTQIDAPGATDTGAAGINDAGQIVGNFFNSTGEHGSSTAAGPSLKSTLPALTIQRPMASTTRGRSSGIFSTARASTDSSTAAGPSPKSTCPTLPSQLSMASTTRGRSSDLFFQPHGQPYHGFLDSGGTFTQIDAPGANSTQANGINDAGQIVGSARWQVVSATLILRHITVNTTTFRELATSCWPDPPSAAIGSTFRFARRPGKTPPASSQALPPCWAIIASSSTSTVPARDRASYRSTARRSR